MRLTEVNMGSAGQQAGWKSSGKAVTDSTVILAKAGIQILFLDLGFRGKTEILRQLFGARRG